MKILTVSNATYLALAGLSINGFSSPGVSQPDGSWRIRVEDDTWERLDQLRLQGESDDDVIARMIRGYLGRKPD